MAKENYQALLVGVASIPPTVKERWKFLYDLAKNIQNGQAIRMIMPEGEGISGVISRWQRIAREKGLRGKIRQIKQQDKTYVLYLWFERNKT